MENFLTCKTVRRRHEDWDKVDTVIEEVIINLDYVELIFPKRITIEDDAGGEKEIDGSRMVMALRGEQYRPDSSVLEYQEYYVTEPGFKQIQKIVTNLDS
jgi:hypothetical protein